VYEREGPGPSRGPGQVLLARMSTLHIWAAKEKNLLIVDISNLDDMLEFHSAVSMIPVDPDLSLNSFC